MTGLTPWTVDPHVHFFEVSRGYPWLEGDPPPKSVAGDVRAIAKNYLPCDYFAEAAPLGVERVVHVDAGAADPLAETRWLANLPDGPDAIVARVPLDDPGADALMAAHCREGCVVGVRHIVNWHADPALTFVDRPDLLTDPAWRDGFAALERHGLSFDLQLYPEQMADAATLASEHPRTAIILNHAGMPLERDDPEFRTWRRGMQHLADCPNVSVKISGLGMVDHFWTAESIAEIVDITIDLFGADRTMLASNFPVDRLYSDLAALHLAFCAITETRSEEERAALFGGTAARIYRLAEAPC